MMDRSYSFRINRWSPETVYWTDLEVLHWSNARGEGCLAFAAIRRVRAYKVRFFGSRTTYWRCDLIPARGRRIRLQAAHYGSNGQIEDRTAAYIPFIKQLESRLAQANPGAAFESNQRLALSDAMVGSLVVIALKLIRLVDFYWAANTAAWLMRRIGPSLKGHRVARANLLAAYPGQPPAEIERILGGMWDNLGRVFVEYAHLDRLWDFDPARADAGHILIERDDRRRFLAAMGEKRPALAFGAHLANWELLLWAIGSRSEETAVIYRPLQIAAIDRELSKIRTGSKAKFIQGYAQALLSVRNLLRRGGAVGIIVDEHFPRGIEVTFFGRPCLVTPIFGRLAREFDCPIYGGRVVRLPGGKFRLDVTDPLMALRDADGKIDVAATMQMITGVIEGWIKEHPEQWLWLQRRWR